MVHMRQGLISGWLAFLHAVENMPYAEALLFTASLRKIKNLAAVSVGEVSMDILCAGIRRFQVSVALLVPLIRHHVPSLARVAFSVIHRFIRYHTKSKQII